MLGLDALFGGKTRIAACQVTKGGCARDTKHKLNDFNQDLRLTAQWNRNDFQVCMYSVPLISERTFSFKVYKIRQPPIPLSSTTLDANRYGPEILECLNNPCV